MEHFAPVSVRLIPSIFKTRMDMHRQYMMELDPKRLLANYYAEAGLNSNRHFNTYPKHYPGWEEPDQQTRGSYPGHYLSACAMRYAFEGDQEMKRRGDEMVAGLAECQKEGENNWVGSIPSLYLERIARGKWVWAPQYQVHKTFMGLIDMYRFAGNQQALEIADKWADWFVNWTDRFNEDQLAQLADWESGGLMESWADLYEITKDEKYKKLIARYYRKNLFDPLIRGEKNNLSTPHINGKNALSFMHANTSIPEAQGCARSYEVTGEEKYRKAVEMFWHFAVEVRDAYATGGQSNHEAWWDDLSEDLGDRTQEFCTMYNMIRLADYLLRWTGESKYADYIERCYYNGVLAHHNQETADYCYMLPMGAGNKKKWEGKYDTFFCCCGTMTQAQASYGNKILYRSQSNLYLSQYIPFSAQIESDVICMDFDRSADGESNGTVCYKITLQSNNQAFSNLYLRKPDWTGRYELSVNGARVDSAEENGWIMVNELPLGSTDISLTLYPHIIPIRLCEKDNRFAFRFGPILMAAFSDKEYFLQGKPEEIAEKIDTKKMIFADPLYRDGTYLENASGNFKLIPLYRVTNETYQIYFPIIDR